MTRYLKVLGLALVAMLALAAISASAASAKGVITSDGPFLANGEVGTEGSVLTAFGLAIQCGNVSYNSLGQPTTFAETIETEEPHDPIFESGDSEITVTPTFGECVAAGFLPMTVDMTGCDLDGELSEESEEAGVWDLTVVLTCPTSHAPEITIFLSEAAHTADEPFCHVTIFSSAIGEHLEGGTAANTGEGHIELGGVVVGIGAERSGPCAAEEHSSNTDPNVKLEATATASGENEEAEPTEIEISEE